MKIEVMEKLLEDLSFHGPERTNEEVSIDQPFVTSTLSEFLESEDLSRYIL